MVSPRVPATAPPSRERPWQSTAIVLGRTSAGKTLLQSQILILMQSRQQQKR